MASESREVGNEYRELTNPVKLYVKSWIVGLALTFVIVALGIIGVHTPLQFVAFIFSIPLMPALFLFEEATRGSSMGETTLTAVMYTSQVLFGSLVYGVLIFLVLRLWNRRKIR